MSNVSGTAADTMAIYVRTSTTDQDGAAQLHALHRAAASATVVRVSVDGGSRWPSWAMTWWSPVSRNWRT